MHIPDGFLDVKTCVATGLAGAGMLGYALRQAQGTLNASQVHKVALTGAFIFAAQMLNFPIAGSTSGHFLGGAMAAILFGPRAAVILMSAVLVVQALLFQDGGLAALGANVLCTGVIGSYAGYGVYRAGTALTRGKGGKAISFLSAWCSIVAASAGVALLLAWSHTVPLGPAQQAMIGWHSLIGVGEGLVTMLAVAYLTERRAVGSPIPRSASDLPFEQGAVPS